MTWLPVGKECFLSCWRRLSPFSISSLRSWIQTSALVLWSHDRLKTLCVMDWHNLETRVSREIHSSGVKFSSVAQGTPQLHHLCLYIWLNSSNWVISAFRESSRKVLLPPKPQWHQYFIDLFLKESKAVRCTSSLKSLLLELTLLASCRLKGFRTPGKHFLSPATRTSELIRLCRACSLLSLKDFAAFFGVSLLLRLSSAACSLDRCQEEMVED